MSISVVERVVFVLGHGGGSDIGFVCEALLLSGSRKDSVGGLEGRQVQAKGYHCRAVWDCFGVSRLQESVGLLQSGL